MQKIAREMRRLWKQEVRGCLEGICQLRVTAHYANLYVEPTSSHSYVSKETKLARNPR